VHGRHARAAAQIRRGKQQQLIQPTAVFCVVFYLTLELLLTRQLTNVFFTEAAAILALDQLSRPWDCASVVVRVTLPPDQARRRWIFTRSSSGAATSDRS
jgi:hypothetical protein